MRPGSLNKHLLLAAGVLLLAGCDSGVPDREAAGNAELIEDAPPVPDSSAPGVTPMAERVAVLGVLNKRNNIVRDIELKPGQALRVSQDLIVRLRACETTAPWEEETLTGAFVQVDVKERGAEDFSRIFSGWLYKESPSLNIVEHRTYDVWPKSCTMSWPEGPPPPPARGGASIISSLSNEGGEEADDAGDPLAPLPPVDSASDSNDR